MFLAKLVNTGSQVFTMGDSQLLARAFLEVTPLSKRQNAASLLNPYEAFPLSPVLLESIICFADILGFSAQSRASLTAGTGDDFLAKINSALSTAYEYVRDNARRQNFVDRYCLKTFTDNAVIGFPEVEVEPEKRAEDLDNSLLICASFQSQLVMHGFLLRGAIAYGKHYMNNDIVFGDALLEAVDLDRHGGAPRLVLSPSAIRYLIKHVPTIDKSKKSSFLELLLHDSDGLPFVDYLNHDLLGPLGDVFIDHAYSHRTAILEGIENCLGNPEAIQKWAWVAGYHNFICRRVMAKESGNLEEDDEDGLAWTSDKMIELEECVISPVQGIQLVEKFRIVTIDSLRELEQIKFCL